MKKVILAGTYPAHTFEKLRAMLPEEEFELKAVVVGIFHNIV